ncbi:acyl-protein synthetase [Luteimonas sp BLCC-B24]|uniref:LuxE/PaaK family acyltransferase n=1 Tax=Luteimonas sp. BLCC-B24 TaxID=3025317 RepID=UPI00234C2014|nr:acyl-protein synthetase [Luteimonas sp. BLCC-B24]MDC7807946.1 acyl-protein synthetase [Luteimonas sp. BLCC-B24]
MAGALDIDVFGLDRDAKRAWLLQGLQSLTRFHHARCAPYSAMLDALWRSGDANDLEALPWLPVRLFKQIDLKSIPDDQVSRTLVSSGTTGAAVSRIFLDADTARAQTRALTRIFSHFAGNRRMRMLVVDDASFLRDRSRFNARAAGILGFSNFGRDHLYLLDEDLQPDWRALAEWLAKAPDEPVLLFGFTFIVWQSFVQAAQRDGIDLRFPPGSMLVHGGGWKKMEEQKVDNTAYKAALAGVFGIERVHNYYGMVEQVGSIFFECEQGHLHAPAYADVIVRDLQTLAPAADGQEGALQVLSLLPGSYPGHSLLTEDLGIVHGEDDCPCGRLGKHFSVLGRLKNVEVRGCSDTRTVPSA